MSIISRIKHARLVRVLLVYLGASWVVVEAADLLQSALELPEWVVPVTIILLLVGLVVVASTAWVQGSATTDRREMTGEVPTDWQLDLPDLARSVRRGRLPHLTWGRVMAGGAVAFAALFGLAALVVLTSDDGAILAPDVLTDEPAAPGLAVIPFSVSGAELESWQEGMVDLLSRNLDGLGGLRAIDSRTVLARWRERVPGDDAPDLATTLDVAERTGARWALVGSAVQVGPLVRVAADVYDVETGQRLDRATVEGSPDSLLTMVDRLSVDVARSILSRENPDLTRLRLASITTSSPEALRAFLQAEAAYRRSSFEPSIEALEEAVTLDSAFALAHYRLGSARGWIGRPGAAAARRRAYQHRDRLPVREALLVGAEYRARAGALPSGVALLRDGVRRYPDDPEMWYQLGDVYLHWGPQLGVGPAEADQAFRKAVELDPGFAPYHIHVVDLALLRGDSAEAARRLEAELAHAGQESRATRAHRLLFDYIYESPSDRERVLAALDTIDRPVLEWLSHNYSLEGDAVGDALSLGSAACEELLDTPDASGATRYSCLLTFLANGRIPRVHHHAAAMRARGREVIPATASFVLRQTGMDPSAPVGDMDALLTAPRGPDGLVSPGLIMAGILAAEQDRPAMADSVIRTLSREAAAHESAGDTLDARIIRGLVEGVNAYRALGQGRSDQARARLEESAELLAGSIGPEASFRTLVIWPLAELHSAEGRYEEALELFESLWQSLHAGPALLRRADIHERLGHTDRAAELRRAFLALWSGAEPHHPMVQDARRALPPG